MSQPPRTDRGTSRGILRRIFSVDHKTIGKQYFFLSLAAALIGVALSALMRIHLVWPDTAIPFFGAIKPEQYLSLMTMHGTLMIFFVLTTAPQGAFGNYFLPLQIGAGEMAFPRLNMLSFWLTFVALLVLLSGFFVTGGASISGWTHYTPLSAVPSAGPGQGLGLDLWIASIGLFCLGSVLGSINFIVTVLDRRAPGMTMMRLPLTVWAWLITAILSLLAFTVLHAAILLLFCDRHMGTSFFVPEGVVVNGSPLAHSGGSPLLWQHLFWFFGHPEVYIAILPGMGLTSHLLSTFSRKPVFGYRAMVWAMIAIGALGFMVWGHHMFVSGMNPFAAFAFSLMTMVIGVPSAIKTFNWLGTMWGGSLRLTVPMMFAIGFVSVFVTGGLSGPILAQPALDMYLHDTYFVVAHFHLIMGVAAVMGIFAGTYYWFPKMFGRLMSARLGYAHFWFTFIGAYMIFLPMHFLGMAGHPRRYSQLTDVHYLQALLPLQRFISIAAFITIAGQLIFLFNLFWSLRKGERAEANPWQSTTCEWSTLKEPAEVIRGPYEFNVPGATSEYLMQCDEPEAS